MKLGRRHARHEERLDTAIGSMVNGTIGGQSKRGMPVVEVRRMPLVAAPPSIPCLTFDQQAFTSSTSWDVVLPDGEADDFMFAYVLTTENPSTTPTGWIEEQLSTTLFGSTRYRWYRRLREEGDTTLPVTFSSPSTGSVILVNAQIDPTFPGDSWGGAAYNGLSGDFAGVTEPFNFETFNGGPYDPDGSIFIMQVRHTGGETSYPGAPWEFATYGTAGTATHQVFYWQGTGDVPDFTWDTTGSTRDITFIELAHLCDR